MDKRDLFRSQFFQEHTIKEYPVGCPKVTPASVSASMTGLSKIDLPFLRCTPYKKPMIKHIPKDEKTILHYAAEELELKVFQYGTPLCADIELPEGCFSGYDHLLQQNRIPEGFQHVKDRKSVV